MVGSENPIREHRDELVNIDILSLRRIGAGLYITILGINNSPSYQMVEVACQYQGDNHMNKRVDKYKNISVPILHYP